MARTPLRHTRGMSGAHSYSREAAEPFAIRTLRETFEAYPPKEQARIRAEVRAKLLDETRRGQRQKSALARYARPVYGVKIEDL
jgi:hypothetical protein